MHAADESLLAVLKAHGLSPEKLFIAGEQLFVSDSAVDFRSGSDYSELPEPLRSHAADLLAFARRMAVPEYRSLQEADDEIVQCAEWERTFSGLMRVLETHGVHDSFGDGDYYLIEDYYGSPQHKIECTSLNASTPELIADIQAELADLTREWEVILVHKKVDGRGRVTLVYRDRHVELHDRGDV